MASTSSSKSGVQTSACHGVGLLCLLMLAPLAAATQFKVGGPDMGWKVPSDPNAMSYNKWAAKMRFQIGDSLLFVYAPDNDSVLQVNDQDYGSCNTAKPIARFDDGNTEFTFKQSGRYCFISGVQDNCLKNESVVVVVMADRNGSSSGSGSGQTPPSPAPSPSTTSPPPPAPVPSPPSPPPSGSVNIVPSPPPSGGQSSSPPPPPPNAASLRVVGAMSSIGTLLGSLLFFVV